MRNCLMYSFRDYSQLNDSVRSVASRYWAEVIKQRVGATCANQVLAAHLSDEITSVPGWSDNYSRFWNRIFDGKPVAREGKVNESDKVVPGTKSLLLHPLWQLLNTSEHDTASLIEALEAIPYELHSKIIERKQSGEPIIKETLHPKVWKKLFGLTSIDCLLVWLVLAKKAQIEANAPALIQFEMNILRVYFRLVVLTEFSAITTPLYELIAVFLDPDDFHSRISSLNQLPVCILPSKAFSPEKLANRLKGMLQDLVIAGIIDDSIRSKELFLYCINHSSSHNLTQDLSLFANGTFNRSCIGEGANLALDRYDKAIQSQPIANRR